MDAKYALVGHSTPPGKYYAGKMLPERVQYLFKIETCLYCKSYQIYTIEKKLNRTAVHFTKVQYSRYFIVYH